MHTINGWLNNRRNDSFTYVYLIIPFNGCKNKWTNDWRRKETTEMQSKWKENEWANVAVDKESELWN